MRVYRSPLKMFLFGAVGVILVAGALDVGIGHWLATPPEANDGVLTSRGHAQQRGDSLWGGTMAAAGVLVFGASVAGLIRRRPVLRIAEEGLEVAVGGDSPSCVPWRDVASVSSSVLRDPYDGSSREHLIVEFRSDASIPLGLAGTTIGRRALYIDAHDWAIQVTDVALAAQGAHDHFTRIQAMRTYQPPSMVWETTVRQPVPKPETVDGGGDP